MISKVLSVVHACIRHIAMFNEYNITIKSLAGEEVATFSISTDVEERKKQAMETQI